MTQIMMKKAMYYGYNEKMKNKILTALAVFLFLGLYIDLKMQDKGRSYCTAQGYQQRNYLVQFIIPFVPQRHMLIFGVGNKHYDHSRYIRKIWLGEKVEGSEDLDGRYTVRAVEPNILLKEVISNYGCTYQYQAWKDGTERSYYGGASYRHFIDLRPFSRIREDGEINITIDDDIMTQEIFDDRYNN